MRNKLALAAAAALALLSLQGCADKDVIEMAPVPQIQSAFSPDIMWDSSVGDGVGAFYSQLRPVVDENRIFAASRDGIVQAMDAKTGKRLWRIDLSDLKINEDKRSVRLSGGLTSDNGNLYFGSEDGLVYAVSEQDGKLLWTHSVPGEVVAAPAVNSGKVVISLTSGTLVALDQQNGDQEWSFTDDQPSLLLRGASTPLIAGGAVFYGRPDGKVAVVLLSNGQLAHQFQVTTAKGGTELARMVDVNAAPLIRNNVMYAIAYNGQLVANNVMTGQQLWKRKYTSYRNIAADGLNLYVTDDRNHIYSIDSQNGAEQWSNDLLEYRNVTAPVVYGDYLVVGDDEGYLYWFDLNSGKLKAMSKLSSSGIYAAPVVADGTLYVQVRDGKLFAIRHA
ncbi:outer membrane protein assembly factor BamB [Dongshaea marina]|uniref:outer membrane protein assembly factor BamB n=1 Tax=Dongshaea marina TaxID=2047966 RepID=UPI000D3EC467|nr:outer membrane protein assembly factor BamB [Dongshaea marina]